MPDQFSRTELLIGADGLARLARARVAIFGIGGVGSYTAEGLVRAGVGRFVLVDDDRICLTNLNRQLHATRRTVGRLKVEAMAERMLEINPAAEITTFAEFYGPGSADRLLPADLDYVVDAIDTMTGKLDLIVQAKRRNLPVISCMGAGNKLDPTRWELADLAETTVCPLARVLRKELRRRGITSLKVLYSREEPTAPVMTEASDCSARCICPKGTARTCTVRRQIPGSVSYMPSIAGLILAGEVIRDLLAPARAVQVAGSAALRRPVSPEQDGPGGLDLGTP